MPVVVGSDSYHDIIMYHGIIYDIGQNMIYNIDIKSGVYRQITTNWNMILRNLKFYVI